MGMTDKEPKPDRSNYFLATADDIIFESDTPRKIGGDDEDDEETRDDESNDPA